MQTHVSPEDLMLSFQSSNEYFGNISLQKSASIQPRTSGSKLLIHTYQYTPQVINTALVSPVDAPLGPGGRCIPLSDWTRSHRAPLATPSAYPPHPRARSAADRKAPCMRIAQAGLEPTICPIFVNTPQSVEMVDSYSTIINYTGIDFCCESQTKLHVIRRLRRKKWQRLCENTNALLSEVKLWMCKLSRRTEQS